jgi:hypothetical protein
MRTVLVSTAVFAVLLFVGFLLLSGSSIVADLVKTLVVSAVFALYQVWALRRRTRQQEQG